MDKFLKKMRSEEIRNIRYTVESGIPRFVSAFSELMAPYAEFLNSIKPKIESYRPALERIAEVAEAFEALDKLGGNQYVLWKPLSRELVAAIKTATAPEECPGPETADNRKVWYNVWDEAKAKNRRKPEQTAGGRPGRFYAAKAS